MEIALGILLLALIILGLRNRKKEKKEWVREERYEESGAWIDKRSGERGTYGSLDEEMEANRLYIARQSKISELAQIIQAFCFAQLPDFQKLGDEKIKRHHTVCKSEASGLFEKIEGLIKTGKIRVAETISAPSELLTSLKKQVLGFSYERFPKLLDLEIEEIQKFDLVVEQVASRVLEEFERLNA